MADRSSKGKGRRWPPASQRQFRKRLRRYRDLRSGGRTRRIPRAAVPSFFTLMNLLSGFIAITQAHEGNFDAACWLILLAGFFDALDGMMARLTNGTSLFGVELDSLADAVSFGAAPAFLVWTFGLHNFGMLGLIVSSLPAICGVVRLARFNLQFDGEKKDHFSGLPIPAQALFLAVLVLNFNHPDWFSMPGQENMAILIPIVVLLALLMISSIPFDSIPTPTPAHLRLHPVRSSLFALGGVLIILFAFTSHPHFGFVVVISVYLAVGIGRAVLAFIRDVLNTPIE